MTLEAMVLAKNIQQLKIADKKSHLLPGQNLFKH